MRRREFAGTRSGGRGDVENGLKASRRVEEASALGLLAARELSDHAIHRLDQLLPWNWKTESGRLVA